REELNIQKNDEFKKVRILVLEAIGEFGQEQDYDLIVSDGVLFANERIDVTERILESLRQESVRLQSAN
ncbi:OmpH family outer membrane protein, partial [Granulosicoccus sp.]